MEKYQYMSLVTEEMVKYKLPKRCEYFHKGNFGKLFTVCGSKKMPGAALFVINAAIKTGVGMIKACAVPSVYKKIENFEPTFFVAGEDEEGFMTKESLSEMIAELNSCTAAVVGPGLGLNENTMEIVYEIIRKSEIPLVIDADGINAVSQNIDVLKESKCKIILTPHFKEMSRLSGLSIEEIKKDKIQCASEFARNCGVLVALKGPKTVICDENDNVFVSSTGNVGMAKGGSGDVLAGIIGSLAAQGVSLLDAGICGVFIHGLAGDLCKEDYSSVSMTPTDIIRKLPEIFLNFGL